MSVFYEQIPHATGSLYVVAVEIQTPLSLTSMLRPVARLFFLEGGGGSNWSNFGIFYDYAWIILRSC